MTCHSCRSTCKRFGRHRNGLQRFRCKQCNKTYTEEHERPLDTMRIPLAAAENVLRLLLEGMSVRSVERVTSVHRDTILKLIVLAGDRCRSLMQERIRGVNVTDVQVDEIWGYVFKKEGHKWNHEKDIDDIGDAYCFVALERNTKLVLTYHLGKRDALSTDKFIHKLSFATGRQRYQLTSDGFKAYIKAVQMFLMGRVHFAQLVKVYAADREGEQRYSPAEVVDMSASAREHDLVGEVGEVALVVIGDALDGVLSGRGDHRVLTEQKGRGQVNQAVDEVLSEVLGSS